MTQKDILCFKLLSAKYFPDGDVFKYKQYDKPSFTWSSIAKTVDVLKDGFLWQVGDDDTINIRRDHWGIEGINGESACRSPFTNEERKVRDLEETLIHSLKDCPKAREILVTRGLNNRLLEGDYSNEIDWPEEMFRELDNKAAANFLTLLWNSWNDRNNMVFKGKMDAVAMIWEMAQTLSRDFRIFNFTEPSVFSPTMTNKDWEKPPLAMLK
ncbi:hypothetical protein J1N35_039808 [Gossypium stocksii]|uniref:Reverse transcriptase n=1 Tax=Gossypium stocksii TaxID=47602 RepID=A0A9D3ZH51_9ROSI|nr:hypothetical protein J1N35_039808 [Gossypium stocksii]